MTEKQEAKPAAEPLLWAFYQQLPGRSGSIGVCTVRSKEDVEELRENGIEVFPLYGEPVERPEPPPRGLRTTPPERRTIDAEAARWAQPPNGALLNTRSERRYASPPLSVEELDLALRPEAARGPASHPPMESDQSALIRKMERLREALLPFAILAELVKGKEDDETLLSLQAGPLQWKHITAADIRRAGAAFSEVEEA